MFDLALFIAAIIVVFILAARMVWAPFQWVIDRRRRRSLKDLGVEAEGYSGLDLKLLYYETWSAHFEVQVEKVEEVTQEIKRLP